MCSFPLQSMSAIGTSCLVLKSRTFLKVWMQLLVESGKVNANVYLNNQNYLE